MTDYASNAQGDDQLARVHAERESEDVVRGVTNRLSSLLDPCTSAQLAKVLDKSPMTIVDWCQEREFTRIPCFRLGNRWYHRVPELVRWLSAIEDGRIDFRRRPRSTFQRK